MKTEEQSLEERENELRTQLSLMKSQQNISLAIIAGFISSVFGASLWAAITVMTEYRIFWMAIGVGALVGISVRVFGKGMNTTHGIVGAAFSLLGCVLGNFLSIAGFLAVDEGVTIFEVLKTIDYSLVPQIMVETFSWLDPAYYLIALIMGYKLGFKPLSLYEQTVLTENRI